MKNLPINQDKIQNTHHTKGGVTRLLFVQYSALQPCNLQLMINLPSSGMCAVLESINKCTESVLKINKEKQKER